MDAYRAHLFNSVSMVAALSMITDRDMRAIGQTRHFCQIMQNPQASLAIKNIVEAAKQVTA